MSNTAMTLIMLTAITGSGVNLQATGLPLSTSDSASFSRRGFLFDIGSGPHYSSASGDAGYMFTMGFGYQVTSRFSLGMKFYTGDENIAQQADRPVWGRFRTGGASLESTVLMTGGATLVPYVSLGFGLYTIETRSGEGYNGNGLDATVGIQMDLSQYFSLGVSVRYTPMRFYNTVGDTDPDGIFRPFDDHILGVATSLTFYPDILP